MELTLVGWVLTTTTEHFCERTARSARGAAAPGAPRSAIKRDALEQPAALPAALPEVRAVPRKKTPSFWLLVLGTRLGAALQSAPERYFTAKMACAPMFALPAATPTMIVPAVGACAATMGGVNLAGFIDGVRPLDFCVGAHACSVRSVLSLSYFAEMAVAAATVATVVVVVVVVVLGGGGGGVTDLVLSSACCFENSSAP